MYARLRVYDNHQTAIRVLTRQARSQDFNHEGLRQSQEGLRVGLVASAEGAKPLSTRGAGGAS